MGICSSGNKKRSSFDQTNVDVGNETPNQDNTDKDKPADIKELDKGIQSNNHNINLDSNTKKTSPNEEKKNNESKGHYY